MEDKLVVRLLGPHLQDAGDITHSAVLKWASAKMRQPAHRAAKEAPGDSTLSTGFA